MEKVFLPMPFYATRSSEIGSESPFSMQAVRSLIPAIMNAFRNDLDHNGSKIVVDCFSSKEVSEACVRLAIKNHIIPEYDDYIVAVNQINQNGMRVECDTSTGDSLPKE